jgi:hypothetical protein
VAVTRAKRRARFIFSALSMMAWINVQTCEIVGFRPVGSRTGAVFRRASLSVAPLYLFN